MDIILKGLISSANNDTVKKRFLQRIADSGADMHPVKEIHAVLSLSGKMFLQAESDHEVSMGLVIWKSWAQHNHSSFSEFFDQNFLLFLLSENHNRQENVPLLLKESFALLQHTSIFTNHVKVVEAKCITFIREHQDIKCVGNFASFLMKFKECIPKGDFASTFCSSLIYVLAASTVPLQKEHAVSYIGNVTQIITLIVDIWKRTSTQSVLECLRVVFDIISTVSDVEPSFCLGMLLQYIDVHMIEIALKNTVLNPDLSNESLIASLQRMVDWAKIPGIKCVDVWVVGFLRGLASVHRYTVLMNLTEMKILQLFLNLKMPGVREVNFNILSHLLLGYQHSSEPFHKVLQCAAEVITDLTLENSLSSRLTLNKLAELFYCLMYHHTGFPDLYDPLLALLKQCPQPELSQMKKMLTDGRWCLRPMDGVSRSYSAVVKKSETGKTGLHNLGNSCYMNSVLQALFMCDSFRHMVLIQSPTPEQTFMPKLQHVFAFLSLSQRPTYAPLTFLEASRPPWFTKGCQQDCSEFFKYMLVQLQEQEMATLKKEAARSQDESDEDRKSKIEKMDPTLVCKTFCGKIKTKVTCMNCRNESFNSELFLDLSLAFPEYQICSQKTLAGGSAKTTNEAESEVAGNKDPVANPLSLNDLLRYYFQPEALIGANQYHCDECGGLQDAQRRQEIVESPEYLVLTLLRFSYDARLKSRTKIFNDVKYPKTLVLPVHRDTLHIKTKVKESGNENMCNFVASQLGKQGCDNKLSDVEIYGLCAVIVHSGSSSECGHYYCYARHSTHKPLTSVCADKDDLTEDDIDFLQDKWYLFNDSRVTYANYSSFSNVTKRFTKDTAYLLFYKRIDLTTEEMSVDLNQSISPQRMDPPVRSELRSFVNKDNRLYLQEQEAAARKQNTKESFNPSVFYNWQNKDDEDKGPPGSCGGGGGLGDMDMSGSKFVF